MLEIIESCKDKTFRKNVVIKAEINDYIMKNYYWNNCLLEYTDFKRAIYWKNSTVWEDTKPIL